MSAHQFFMNGRVISTYKRSNRILGCTAYMYFCASKCFKLSYHEPKTSFYKSQNALYSKSRPYRGCFDEIVMLKLIESYYKSLLFLLRYTLCLRICVYSPGYDSFIMIMIPIHSGKFLMSSQILCTA